MNKYESVIIVTPTMNDKQQKEIENKYAKLNRIDENIIKFIVIRMED